LPAGLLAASGPLLAPLALGYKASSNTPCNLMQAILMVIGEPCQRAKALNCMHNPHVMAGYQEESEIVATLEVPLQGEEGMPSSGRRHLFELDPFGADHGLFYCAF
jgi:hypothetical protein